MDLVDPSEVSQAVALAKDGEEDIADPATRKQEDVRLEASRPAEEQPEQQPEEAKAEEQAPKEPEPEPEPKPVEAEKEPEPVPQPQEVKKEPEPAPDPEPKPVEAKPAPEKPKVAAPKPRRKPKKKLAKKKPQKKRKFDADALTALLDKSVDKTTPQRASEGSGTPRKAERNAIGDKAELSATERDWLIDKINQCYSIPAGVEDARLWQVTLQFRTDGSGQVFGVPLAVKSSGGAQGKVAVETATRALFKCAPYDRFESFKNNEFRINFDPDRMVNG
ncbi:MAG: hypothetical protein AAGF81_08815 [Pseudomonadota bacterium]